MIGDQGPRYRTGRIIRAGSLNRASRMAENLARTRLGGHQTQVDGIPLNVLPDVTTMTIYRIKTPTGGMPARSGTTMGHADCHIWAANESGVLSDTGQIVTVWNDSGGAYAGSKYGKAMATQDGRLTLISIEC